MLARTRSTNTTRPGVSRPLGSDGSGNGRSGTGQRIRKADGTPSGAPPRGAVTHRRPHLKATGYRYQRAIPRSRVAGVRSFSARASAQSRRIARGILMKSTLKRFGYHATMLLGTFAAFAFVVDGAKRW